MKRSEMNRRLMLSTVLAGTATAVVAPVVYGRADWCDDDPLVTITTPTGTALPVHITVSAEGTENKLYLDRIPVNQSGQNAWINWSISQSSKYGNGTKSSGPAGETYWDVTVRVTVQTDPGDGKRFRTRAVASSETYGSGEVFDSALGIANREMELRFSMWAA
jgi:hypothetical protein